MTIQKLERVLRRIRAENPGKVKVSNQILRRAIMHEIGTDARTVRDNRKALKDLGWIKCEKSRFRLTGKDLTDS
jgi:hypothetical protein